MFPHFLKASGTRLALLASFGLILSGCLYGFTGGGLPPHIDTIAVLAFQNRTAQPLLSTELQLALQNSLPRNLGVRLASEERADAVVRGRIINYEEAAPGIAPNPQRGGQVEVTQRQVRITMEAEIYDVREDKTLWQAGSITAVGNYLPDREQAVVGQERAIKDLVQKVIDGAQSQW